MKKKNMKMEAINMKTKKIGSEWININNEKKG